MLELEMFLQSSLEKRKQRIRSDSPRRRPKEAAQKRRARDEPSILVTSPFISSSEFHLERRVLSSQSWKIDLSDVAFGFAASRYCQVDSSRQCLHCLLKSSFRYRSSHCSCAVAFTSIRLSFIKDAAAGPRFQGYRTNTGVQCTVKALNYAHISSLPSLMYNQSS